LSLLPRGAAAREPTGWEGGGRRDGRRGPGADAPEAGGLRPGAPRRQQPPAPQGALRYPACRHR
jgi:hypothetical protein